MAKPLREEIARALCNGRGYDPDQMVYYSSDAQGNHEPIGKRWRLIGEKEIDAIVSLLDKREGWEAPEAEGEQYPQGYSPNADPLLRWRPIETYEGGFVWLGFADIQHAECGRRQIVDGKIVWLNNYGQPFLGEPTHWMRFPPPPQKKDEL